MLHKFINIKNIGKFRDYSPQGDVTFRKLTLLFGENGCGKTTLCAILRSLQTGQPEFISERKMLGSIDSEFVKVLINEKIVAFSNNKWSAKPSDIDIDITIFDSVFIHDNVYSGEYIEHENKKNLYRVIVGEKGVQLAKQIESLDSEIRLTNKDISEKKDAASKILPSGVKLEDYLDWKPIEDIESKIQQKKKEINLWEKKADINKKSFLEKIILPMFPSDFLTILAKSLTDITADAETFVQKQIKNHQMENSGQHWLLQGLGYVRDNLCPFCGQGIQDNKLIAAYHSYFNTAYKNLKQEVTNLNQLITNTIGDAILRGVCQKFSDNKNLIEFWNQFIQVSVPDLPFEDIQAKYSILEKLSLELAKSKQQAPVETVVQGNDFETVLDEVQSFNQAVEGYNAAVVSFNTKITELKQQSVNINTLYQDLNDLEAKKKRFEANVVQMCQDYQSSQKAKSDLEDQKQSAKNQIDQHNQIIFQTYENAINKYLDQFNAGFRIVNTKHGYQGGTPHSSFQIQINNTPIDVGKSQACTAKPCFKTALSSGDKSALALAFFLTAIEKDPRLDKKIVVLDDPFTSLDSFRRTCTQQLIKRIVDKAKQVIVLSHDPLFLKPILKGSNSQDIKVLQLHHNGNNTMISEWDIEAETQSTYFKNYTTLSNFYNNRIGIPLDVARTIRPFLEGFLRAHFPGRFQPNEWLGDFIEKIRNPLKNDGLQHIQNNISELEKINDYSKKYHHEQYLMAQSEPLSIEELHGFVKRTLQFTDGT